MTPVDPDRLAKAVRRLTAAVNAKSSEAADSRLDRFALNAIRSPRNTDAAFAAVQTLRDLETIDRAEAAYLFGQLIEYRIDRERETRDPALERAIEDDVEYELIMAAMRDRELARAAAFHRERGEDELAEMLVQQPDEYGSLCAEGQLSLIDEKPLAENEAEPKNPPADAKPLFERVLALASTESGKEWMPAWLALTKEMRDAEPAAAVAVVQSVRDIGAISFDESLVLIDMAIGSLVDEALEADREYHRLERAIAECNRQHGIDEGDGAADETRPLEWRVLYQRRFRRADGITAIVLRRFGEHRLANLAATKPDEYARLRDEIDVGWRA